MSVAPAVDDEPEETDAEQRLRRVLRWALAALVAAAPLFFWRDAHDGYYWAKLSWLELGALLLAIGYLVIQGKAPRGWVRRTAVDVPLLVFVSWAALSLLWAIDKQGALVRVTQLLCAGLMFYVATQTARRSSEAVVLLGGLAVAAFVISFIGELQVLVQWDYYPQAWPPASTFGNRNLAMQQLAPTVPLALIALWSTRTWVRLSGAASAGLCVVYVVETNARAGLVAVGAEVVVLLLAVAWARPGRARAQEFLAPASVFAAVVVVLLVIGAGAPREMASRRGGRVVPSGAAASIALADSASRRLLLWKVAARGLRERPVLGLGMGGYFTHAPRLAGDLEGPFITNTNRPYRAHSDWVQLAAELGAVGVLALLWIFFVILRAVKRTALARGPPVRLLAFAGLAGLAVEAGASFPLQSSMPPFTAALLLACLFAGDDDGPLLSRPVPRPVFVVFIAVGVYSSVTLAADHVRSTRAMHAMQAADAAAARKDYDDYLVHAKAAIADMPAWVETRIRLAVALMKNKQRQEALDAFAVALQTDPYGPSLHYNRSVLFLQLDDFDRAEEQVREGLSGYSRYLPSLLLLAQLRIMRGDADDAWRYLQRARQVDPRAERTIPYQQTYNGVRRLRGER